jgi:hypothetical protein
MMTRAEARKQRKAMDRDRARALKAAARAKLRELRAALKEARKTKAGTIHAAREQCRTHRRLVVERARERHARLLRELHMVTIAERGAAKQRCAEGKQRARTSALSKIEKAGHALQHERAYQKELARIEANNRAARLGIVKATRAERREESAGEVLANIPPEFVPLWTRVQGKIKGSTRRSRTEAFLEYAQEHPHEVIEAQEHGVEATIRELEKRMAEQEHVARRRHYTSAELAEVPF